MLMAVFSHLDVLRGKGEAIGVIKHPCKVGLQVGLGGELQGEAEAVLGVDSGGVVQAGWARCRGPRQIGWTLGDLRKVRKALLRKALLKWSASS